MASTRGIVAGQAGFADERASFNPLVQGSTPWRPTCGYALYSVLLGQFRGPMLAARCAAMIRTPSGHIEQLPSGSWRARVYVGRNPLTGREIRFRKTGKTEVEKQIELGRLLTLAGRTEPLPHH